MHRYAHLVVGFLIGILSVPIQAQVVDLAKSDIIDLSHAYNADTIFWPTSPIKFEHKELAYGDTPGGYFYSSYSFAMPEHGGTHLDAPIHFSRGKNTAEIIPLNQLITSVYVINIGSKAAANRDYRLTLADVKSFEAEHGDIKAGSSVLLRTDWSERWPDTKNYLGDDTPGDASKLRFPSFGVEAIEYLVNIRKVGLVGVDTASIDYGKTTEFKVHQIVGGANIPALENLTNLKQLPPTGALLIALPIKIEGGSGGPARVVSIVPKK
ncbi:MAG: cyclase family protein [Kordiimonadaceae bacterium]|nr:cyclase family protein [Kordiimonadaceae bacterium]